MRTPRSHAEAQEQRYAEILEIDADAICEALIRAAELFSEPGGEVFGPIYERLKREQEAIENARLRMARQQAEAAELAAQLKRGKRSSPTRRGGARA